MCRVRAPGGALAGTVSDIKLPGVVLFLCVAMRSVKISETFREKHLCFEMNGLAYFYAANAASARKPRVFEL